jgi:hypothetical protein
MPREVLRDVRWLVHWRTGRPHDRRDDERWPPALHGVLAIGAERWWWWWRPSGSGTPQTSAGGSAQEALMGERQAPFVAMRTDLRKDERALYLADAAGYSIQEAAGRLFFLWAFCSDRRLELAPEDCDGYAVSDAIVMRFLGTRGIDAILGGGCDELALGERRPDGLIYLRGTSDTVARLRLAQRTARAGGEARMEAHRSETGRFVTETTNVQLAGGVQLVSAPPGDQPATSRPPARASADPQIQIHRDQDPEIPPSAGKAKRASRLTADWQPTRSEANQHAEQVAKARGVNLRDELAKLRDWATGTGARRADWDAVWRNWTRNARPESRRPNHASALELQLERVAMLEREEREQQEAKLS